MQSREVDWFVVHVDVAEEVLEEALVVVWWLLLISSGATLGVKSLEVVDSALKVAVEVEVVVVAVPRLKHYCRHR